MNTSANLPADIPAVQTDASATVTKKKMPTEKSMARKVLLFVFLAWVFDAADSTIYSLTLPLIREEFNLELSTMGYIASIFIFGTFLGAVLLPMLAEKKGRRIGMSACISIFSVSTALGGLASSAFLVGVSRFFTGFGGGAQWPIGAAYLSEMVPAKRRGFSMGIMQAGYPVGFFIAGGIFAAFSTWGWGWRACYLVLLLPILLCIPILASLKESPAWQQAVRNRQQEGVSTRGNDGLSMRQRYRQLFEKKYRKYTFIAIALHVFGAIYSYGLVVWVPSSIMNDFHIDKVSTAQFVMVSWGVGTLGYLIAGPLADRIGRRPVLAIYTLLGLASIAYLNWLQSTHVATLSDLYVPGILIGMSLGVAGVYITYTSEIFPTHLRTLGLGFSVAVGKLTALFVPAVLGIIAQSTSVTLALLVSTVIGVLMIPAVYCGPETAGRAIDETVG